MQKRVIINLYGKNQFIKLWPTIAASWANYNFEPTVIVNQDAIIENQYGTIIRLPENTILPENDFGIILSYISPIFFLNDLIVICLNDVIPINAVKEIDVLLERLDFSGKLCVYDDADDNRYLISNALYFKNKLKISNESFSHVAERALDIFHSQQNDNLYSLRSSNTEFVKNVQRNKSSSKLSVRSLIQRKTTSVSLHTINDQNINLLDLYVFKKSDGNELARHYLKYPLRKIKEFILKLKFKFSKPNLLEIKKKLNINGSRKIISFSLYGQDDRYFKDLVDVINSYKKFFPDWSCRFYLAADTQPIYLSRILSTGSEVFIMKDKGVDARYTFWRFIAADDDIDYLIVRDTDSMCSKRESQLVNEWMKSDKNFHIIRDHWAHNERILGGMWGVRCKNLRLNITTKIKSFPKEDEYGNDQHFLREIIYPVVKSSAFIHDAYPRYHDEDAVVVPIEDKNHFIGAVNTDSELANVHAQMNDYLEKKNFTWPD